MPNDRELTAKEKREVKRLVTAECANYDKAVGCLLLDDDCPMLGICYSNSALCKYFRNAVLPTNQELEAVFAKTVLKKCKHCGKGFKPSGRQAYCSEKCSKEEAKKRSKLAMRKLREN